jgi:glucosyl-dolichyl phosphate glucuronosyltransferase
MTVPLYVVIAAAGQPELLRRTLKSLASAAKPGSYAGVIVAENGPPCGLAAVVAEFPPANRFQHLYYPRPNKSQALNRVIDRIGDALVVFTDDDVQLSSHVLLEYAAAAAGRVRGQFYGGPIVPDYEGEPPMSWLLPLLPRSAGGWQLPVSDKIPIDKPEFIGPNMAAFAADLRAIGGFDEMLGPGKHMSSPGEDTEIQQRLLDRGIVGFYLPEAAIHHFVRRCNTTVEFALHRAERNGIYWGLSQTRRPGFFPRRWLKAHGQCLNDRLRIARWRRSRDERQLVKAAHLEARWRGRWQGVRLGGQSSSFNGCRLPASPGAVTSDMEQIEPHKG